jgi:hypothetical protein
MLAHDPATFAQRIGVPLEQAIATSARAGRLLLEGCQGLVIEGCGFHCYTTPGKTEPEAICTPSVGESAECATPKRSHEHRELAPALSVRVKTANAHALTAA